MPFFGNANARADMVTDPLPAIARGGAGEDVEAGLEPVGEALGDFKGFVPGMFSGVDAAIVVLGSADSEVAVNFDHRVAGRYGFGRINLDFVVILCDEAVAHEQQGSTGNEATHANRTKLACTIGRRRKGK